jgi:hypothetical protein
MWSWNKLKVFILHSAISYTCGFCVILDHIGHREHRFHTAILCGSIFAVMLVRYNPQHHKAEYSSEETPHRYHKSIIE